MNFRAHCGHGAWQHLGTNPSPQGDLINIVYSSAITTTANDFSIQKFTFNAGVQLLPNQWYIATSSARKAWRRSRCAPTKCASVLARRA